MTGKEFIDRVNQGYHGFESDQGFSYLHCLEVEMIDKLSALENEIIEVFDHVEKENDVNLDTERAVIKSLLDEYYLKLKETEKSYASRLDEVIWNRVGSRVFQINADSLKSDS